MYLTLDFTTLNESRFASWRAGLKWGGPHERHHPTTLAVPLNAHYRAPHRLTLAYSRLGKGTAIGLPQYRPRKLLSHDEVSLSLMETGYPAARAGNLTDALVG